MGGIVIADDHVASLIRTWESGGARADWYEAECLAPRCDWRTSGLEPVVEDAAYDHVSDEHPPADSGQIVAGRD